MKTVQIGNLILINEDCLKAMDFLTEPDKYFKIAVERLKNNLN